MQPDIYILDDLAGEAQLLAALGASFLVTTSAARQDRRVYLDSFDGRLHRAGLACVHVTGTCRLEPLEGGRAVAVAACDETQPPRTPRDVPAGRLRDLLARRLGLRALIPVVVLQTDTRVVHLRGPDRRVAARLVVTTWRLEKRRPVTVLRTLAVHPDQSRANVVARLRRTAAAAGLRPLLESPLAWALAASGFVPRAYTSKIDVALAPTLTAREAAQAICRRLLQTMRQNEAGLRADLDTEFLHDFRVAVRRTRAALGELRGVFPERVTQEFKTGFRELGRLTGPARDLDVYLLAEDEIRARVPANLRPGLDPLFTTLRAEREDAQRHVAAALASPSYKRLLRRWAAVLDPPAGRRLADSPTAGLPVRAHARERIHRRWRRLIEHGLAITDDATAADLHALRIHGKKLRYLLEFFASLFPAREISALVRRLKGLQDNLGEHNDLVVQREHLRGELAALADDDEAAAIEALLDVLAMRQRQVRREFAGAFGDFAGAGVSAHFEQLFGPEPAPPPHTSA
jgi:CHAD domain-containing protein